MARKTLDWTAVDGRDKGKNFRITEMSALDAESWAIRAMLALNRTGLELPDEVVESGFEAMAMIGSGKIMALEMSELQPLLDEMMKCVQVVTSAGIIRSLLWNEGGEGDDIEEVATLWRLRSEVFALHTGFSIADALRKYGALARIRLSSSISPGTQTSPGPSEPPLPPGSPATSS